MRVNTMGMYYLLDAAGRGGVQTVVMASSGAVLGLGANPSGRPFTPVYLPIDEEHRLAPEDTYGLSKLLGEQIASAFSRGYGRRCYALRMAGVLRPGLSAESVREHAEPATWNNWLYNYVDARDASRAFRMCLEAADRLPPYDVFFVSAPDSFLVETTRELLARLRLDLVDLAAGLDGHAPMISPAKAERAFGWRTERHWRDLVADAPRAQDASRRRPRRRGPWLIRLARSAPRRRVIEVIEKACRAAKAVPCRSPRRSDLLPA